MAITAESPITVIPGVGAVKSAAYAKLGVLTLGDLIQHYPRVYENRGEITPLSDAPEGVKRAFLLTVGTAAKAVRLRSHKSFLKFRAFDESGSCEIVFFNQDFLQKVFTVGSVFRFYGKVERSGKKLSLSAPAFEPWIEGVALPPLYPVYRLTDGLSQKQIAKDVKTALDLLSTEVDDPLPTDLLVKRNLCTLPYAERNIHAPETAEALMAARRRLVYDEFFCFALGSATVCRNRRQSGAHPCPIDPMPRLLPALPFRLTDAQTRAIGEILSDMKKDIPMNRILVGDVGSGKTVCAAAAMLAAVLSGRQAALMAPTEILARQHYADLSELFGKFGISCGLLIGATPAGEKKKIRAALTDPDPARRLPIVIGTHALLSDGVEFYAPGLIVTDEQHRFGARQRAALAEKNAHAHVLVMSATPIPRSLALVLYGDLDVSRIDGMPPGRSRVDTYVVDESYRARVDDFIRRLTDEGGQVYIVCPAIEETPPDEEGVTLSEIGESLFGGDAEENEAQKPPLHAAVDYCKELRERMPDRTVAFLHGKMKSAEKDTVMREFADGKIQILVSTTVIEVGVNVPNACLMLVENAERFGLSQLHQLRGRVGRGSRKSYCILVAGGEGGIGETSRRRLDVMRSTYDGFSIAEQDLAARGPGDFLALSGNGAIRQSGGLAFRLADAGEDSDLLVTATGDAKNLLAADPELASAPLLRERVERMFTLEEGIAN